ncbi:MAG: FAD-dependent oxidoreductase [Pseudoclavibacter sp.]|nr:FAD-dependent oxidoreductase [Pseudoclavibacter sp.]
MSDADLVIVGGGVAGLAAADRAAARGRCVLLLEAADRPGGMLRSVRLAGRERNIGADAYAVRGGAVQELLEDLGMAGEVVDPAPLGAWAVSGEDAYRLPRTGLLGIPAAVDADVERALGRAGAQRLRRDAELGGLAGAEARSLAELVELRLGRAALERLVTPVARGVYSLDPAELDHRVLVPGLAQRLRETGSLMAAVAGLRRRAAPGAAVRGVGSMERIARALAARAASRGARIRTGARAERIEAGSGLRRVFWRDAGGVLHQARADAVLLTAPPPAGGAPWSPEPRLPEPVPTRVVLLAADVPELDAAPRGTGVLAGAEPGPFLAKALTHVSAKWPEPEREPARHVLRLSYGPRPELPALDDEAAWSGPGLRERAAADASAMLGVRVPAAAVRDAATALWRIPASAARLGAGGPLAELRERAAALSRVGLAGTWVDGTGLASVVPGALRAVDALLDDG